MRQSKLAIKKVQARYNRNFDKRLRNQVCYADASSYVFIKRNTPHQQREGKIIPSGWSLGLMPLFVKQLLPMSAIVQVDDRVEHVN